MRFLAEAFKEDRQRKELTQADLAELSGVSVPTIKNIEANRRSLLTPEDKSLKLLCDVLNTDIKKYFKRDCKVITIQCHKGGCAKTTTTANIAYSLHKLGKKVLVIDTDAQLNLTYHFNMQLNASKNFYTAFSNRTSLAEQIVPTQYEGLDIITNHTSAANLDMNIFILERREYIMQEILQEIKDSGEYDYILIDCAPALNQLNKSILYATDELLIPVEPSPFGLLGLHDLNTLYQTVKKNAPQLNLIGLVITQYDAREIAQQGMAENALEEFKGDTIVLNTRIPRDANVKKSQVFRQPLIECFPRTRATYAYMTLTKEIISIIESRELNE